MRKKGNKRSATAHKRQDVEDDGDEDHLPDERPLEGSDCLLHPSRGGSRQLFWLRRTGATATLEQESRLARFCRAGGDYRFGGLHTCRFFSCAAAIACCLLMNERDTIERRPL